MTAVTLDKYYPFASGPGSEGDAVHEAGWREMMTHMLGGASGVIRGFDDEFLCTNTGTDMVITVGTGRCWMRGHYGRSTSSKNFTIDASDPALNRADAIVLRLDVASSNIVLDVVKGTPTGDAIPVEPALTQNASTWETLVAVVWIWAGEATIDTDWLFNKHVYTTAYAKYFASNTGVNQSIPHNTNTKINFTHEMIQSGDVGGFNQFTQETTDFELLRSGIWQISGQIAGSAHSNFRHCTIELGTGEVLCVVANSKNVGLNVRTHVSADAYLPAGTTVSLKVLHTGGGPIDFFGNFTYITFMWVGP